jgi:hypothetical protein
MIHDNRSSLKVSGQLRNSSRRKKTKKIYTTRKMEKARKKGNIHTRRRKTRKVITLSWRTLRRGVMCTVAAGQRDFKGAFLAADAFDRDPISARFFNVVP